MRRLWTFFLAAVLSLVAVPMSGSDVDSLRINVELRDNGSAIVTETWHIDVSDDITEWYLVADNMGQMTIEDLAVHPLPQRRRHQRGDLRPDVP